MATRNTACDGGRDLLRDRDFRLVVGSVGLSALGDWVAIVALGLEVKEISDSGFAVAGLWICLFGPSVAVAGHVGLLVDRIEASRLLAVISALGAVIAAILGFMNVTALVLTLTALWASYSRSASRLSSPLCLRSRESAAFSRRMATSRRRAMWASV